MFDKKTVTDFNSLPHAEVDGVTGAFSLHNSIFQLTTSRRGRRCIISNIISKRNFNSLPHAEVDLKPAAFRTSLTLFQLTTSRRGRHRRRSLLLAEIHFNSLPHAEVDRSAASDPRLRLSISTHYLTQR